MSFRLSLLRDLTRSSKLLVAEVNRSVQWLGQSLLAWLELSRRRLESRGSLRGELLVRNLVRLRMGRLCRCLLTWRELLGPRWESRVLLQLTKLIHQQLVDVRSVVRAREELTRSLGLLMLRLMVLVLLWLLLKLSVWRREVLVWVLMSWCNCLGSLGSLLCC